MESFYSKNENEPFFVERNGIVTGVSESFSNLTEYPIDVFLHIKIGELANIIKLGPQIEINNIDTETESFLFTKSLEVRFVNIEIVKELDEQIYIVSERPNSRLEDRFSYPLQLLLDNIIGVSIYSVPDLTLLKANQVYLDFFDKPYDIAKNTVGRHIYDFMLDYKDSTTESIIQQTVATGKSEYLKERKYDKFARGITYWDQIITPITEDGKVKFIITNTRDVTGKVIYRKNITKQNEILKRQTALLNLSDEAIYAWDLYGGIVYWNRGAELMYGYSSEEVIGVKTSELLKTSFPSGITNISSILDKHRIWHGEIENTCKYGRKLKIMTRKQVMVNDLGNQIVLTTDRDITESKNAIEKLRESELHLRMAAKGASFGIYSYDFITGEENWSTQLKSLWGIEEDKSPLLDADKLYIGVHPDDRQKFLTAMTAANAPNSDGVLVLDYRIIRPDGAVRWLHVQGQTDFICDGQSRVPWRAAGATIDVTERKLAEQDIKESEEKYRQLFEHMTNGFGLYEVIMDENGEPTDFRCLMVNKAYEKVMGVSYDQVVGKTIKEVNPEADESMIKSYNMVALTGEALYLEYYSNTFNKYFNVYSFSPKKGQFASVFEDISERKQYEMELILAKESAETANQAKSQFLANMSHEIRTPMNGVLGMAQILGMSLHGEDKEMVDMIYTSGNDLLRIINDILDFSKIEAGKVSLSQGKFDLYILVDEVNHIIRHLASENGLEYISYVESEIKGQLLGDPYRIKQILFNLLGNAIKFTEYGKVELSVKTGKVYEDKLQLIFLIKDTGIGVAQDKIDQLFTLFMQVDESATKKYEGTGLGLAISKQLINMMGGDISVESKLGVGSEFLFSIVVEVEMEDEVYIKAEEDVMGK